MGFHLNDQLYGGNMVHGFLYIHDDYGFKNMSYVMSTRTPMYEVQNAIIFCKNSHL